MGIRSFLAVSFILLCQGTVTTAGIGITSARASGPARLRHATAPYRRVASSNRGVIIQMFQWNYASVARECEDFIGPAGYGFVEVGNNVEHITGSSWWTSYQVVSYKVGSKFGDQAAFEDMCRRCRAVGVGVLVDVIVNHMTGTLGPNIGTSGTRYDHYAYPPTYNSTHFHDCGTKSRDIEDWGSQYQIWNCELVNLADLDTGSKYVQRTLADYLNNILRMGAAGFRVDAASLVDPKDMAEIFSLLEHPAYITQEAPGMPWQGISQNGDYQEFRVSELFNSLLKTPDITQLMTIGENRPGWCPSDKAVVFVANHDRERNGALNWQTPALETLATVFMLGWNYGTPEVLSSYVYNDPNDGAPNGGYGTCDGENGWYCQHRRPAIAGMVDFWNYVRGEDINSHQMGSRAQLAWGRGTKGFVAINNSDDPWQTTFHLLLPDGIYCEMLHGSKVSDRCPSQRLDLGLHPSGLAPETPWRCILGSSFDGLARFYTFDNLHHPHSKLGLYARPWGFVLLLSSGILEALNTGRRLQRESNDPNPAGPPPQPFSLLNDTLIVLDYNACFGEAHARDDSVSGPQNRFDFQLAELSCSRFHPDRPQLSPVNHGLAPLELDLSY